MSESQEKVIVIWDWVRSKVDRTVSNIPSNIKDSEYMLPCTLTAYLHFMPGNCGIRVITNVIQNTRPEYTVKNLPKHLSGQKFEKNTDWGHIRYPGLEYVVMSASAKERELCLERQFKKLVKELESHHLHQFILTDSLTHETNHLTRYFVWWLRKNKIGTLIGGPISFNANYISNKSSFIQSWIWIKPSAHTFKLKGNRIHVDIREIQRQMMKKFWAFAQESLMDQYKWAVKQGRPITMGMLKKEYVVKYWRISWKEWREKQLQVSKDVKDVWNGKLPNS
jgi:hypothetical protein